MNFLIGLGNPGDEYKDTRHNIGREIVKNFCKSFDLGEFDYDKKLHAQISKGKLSKKYELISILPDTYMNKSGEAIKKFVNNKKKVELMVVVHDDLDIGIGKIKICFGKKSAGHRGVESIIRAVKTTEFVRIKIGISPKTPSGKVKKPISEKDVIKHVLGKFSPKENEILKKVKKNVILALESIVKEGRMQAMNKFNGI